MKKQINLLKTWNINYVLLLLSFMVTAALVIYWSHFSIIKSYIVVEGNLSPGDVSVVYENNVIELTRTISQPVGVNIVKGFYAPVSLSQDKRIYFENNKNVVIDGLYLLKTEIFYSSLDYAPSEKFIHKTLNIDGKEYTSIENIDFKHFKNEMRWNNWLLIIFLFLLVFSLLLSLRGWLKATMLCGPYFAILALSLLILLLSAANERPLISQEIEAIEKANWYSQHWRSPSLFLKGYYSESDFNNLYSLVISDGVGVLLLAKTTEILNGLDVHSYSEEKFRMSQSILVFIILGLMGLWLSVNYLMSYLALLFFLPLLSVKHVYFGAESINFALGFFAIALLDSKIGKSLIAWVIAFFILLNLDIKMFLLIPIAIYMLLEKSDFVFDKTVRRKFLKLLMFLPLIFIHKIYNSFYTYFYSLPVNYQWSTYVELFKANLGFVGPYYFYDTYKMLFFTLLGGLIILYYLFKDFKKTDIKWPHVVIVLSLFLPSLYSAFLFGLPTGSYFLSSLIVFGVSFLAKIPNVGKPMLWYFPVALLCFV